MDEFVNNDFLLILQYLLPGLLAGWVFDALTSFEKQSNFDKIVRALIFTVLIQAFVFIIYSALKHLGGVFVIGAWSENIRLIWSIVSAFALATIFSFFANNDYAHWVLRKLRVTRETSYPSEWYCAFTKNCYLVLHLVEGRRLYGWPREWPSYPNSGHFVMQSCSWLVIDEDGKQEQMYLDGVDRVLVRACDVLMVEYMDMNGEFYGQESTQSPTT